ncbi:hypothetical protein HI113_43570, partial [Corallococcus exiguus]|uniref:hypothetical protein n=1 Tax=Corallococcus exiguus TaxID=83462 RepID=UPI001474DCEA
MTDDTSATIKAQQCNRSGSSKINIERVRMLRCSSRNPRSCFSVKATKRLALPGGSLRIGTTGRLLLRLGAKALVLVMKP